MSVCLLQTAYLTSEKFKVVFDMYTPRPHFIIFEKELSAKQDLNEDLLHSLVDLSWSFIRYHQDYYAFKQPLLSLHRGCWKSKDEHSARRLHAHVSTDPDSYLKFFNDYKHLDRWPNPAFVTAQWKATKNPKYYDVNVRHYPFKSYASLEAREIAKLAQSVKLNDHTLTHYKDLQLEFHPKAARIGFASPGTPPSNQDRVRLLLVMLDFALEHGMDGVNSDASSDHGGCHICISLSDSGELTVL